MRLMVLRHGATAWNLERRIQGRADPPLSPAGRAEVAAWTLPPGSLDLPCWVSPLQRARETAALLGFVDPLVVAELIEMDWGDFEGETLEHLRAELGATLAANEASGLDFRPPGGESPREVGERLRPWLASLAGLSGAAVVVTHKGVRRTLLALATGWDMRGPPPIKLRDHQALCLDLPASGRLEVRDIFSLVPSE